MQTTAPMVPTPYRILRKKRETHDTFTLEIAPADSSYRPTWLPGQFNMLYLFGVGESAISFSGDPADGQKMVHTIRAVGQVTTGLQALKTGDVIGMRGPFGKPWPFKEALRQDVLIVAGGIGLAPLRPVMYHVMANRALFGRINLLCGFRSPQDVLFRRELDAWAQIPGLVVETTVDHADDRWTGQVGVVTSLIPDARFDPHHSIAMICGPEIMMRHTSRNLLAKGIPKERIYLSMERNMKCAIGHCGACQFGPTFICKDGPVFNYPTIAHMLDWKEL